MAHHQAFELQVLSAYVSLLVSAQTAATGDDFGSLFGALARLLSSLALQDASHCLAGSQIAGPSLHKGPAGSPQHVTQPSRC